MFAASDGAATTRVVRLEQALAESEFEQVSAQGDRLLADTSEALAPSERARVLRSLFLARFYLEDKPAAAVHAQAWLDADPNASLDVKKYPPDVVQFFAEQRAAFAARANSPSTVVEAARTKPSARSFDARSLIPLGIGHFFLGDVVGGVIFSVAEVGFFAANIGLYAARASSRLSDDRYQNPSEANALQIAQNVSAGLLCAAVIVELVDALVFLPDRSAAKQAPTTHLHVSPMGAAVSGTF